MGGCRLARNGVRRWLAAVAGLVLLAPLFGTSALASSAPAQAAAQPHWGGTINVAFAEDAVTLDPQVCYDSVCWGAMGMLFDRLYDYVKNTNNLFPEAASAFPKITNGGKTYTIPVRQGMKFSNGQPVTAQDVVYSLDRILNPKTESPVLGFWDGVVGAAKGASGSVPGIKAIGKYTVQIDLTAPDRAFIYVLAMPQASIIPVGSASKPGFARHPIGSGPFTLVSWNSGVSMIFKRNPDYWDYPKPYVNEVYFHLDVNDNVALLQLEKGQIQVLGDGIPTSDFLSVINTPANKPLLQTRNLESTYFLTMNVQLKPFNNLDVRKAVELAVNKEYLLRLMDGQGEVANELIPPGVAGYQKLPAVQQNDKEARELLAKAGYPNGFTTTLYSWNIEPWTTLDAAIDQELGEIGIKLKVKAIAENAFFGLTSTPKTAPMTLTFWIADFPEASDFFNALVSCAAAVKGGENLAFYCNHTVDSDVAKALANTSTAAATKYYTEADTLLMSQVPIVPLFHSTATDIHAKALVEYFPNPVWGAIYADFWFGSGSTQPPKRG
jgi:ABC-type transport system substrate-binding protein